MANVEIPEDSQLAFSENLSLFSKPIVDVGLTEVIIVEYRPVHQYLSQGSIDFVISNNGQTYINCKKSYIRTTLKVLPVNGQPIPLIDPEETDVPDISRYALINCIHYALWDQVNLNTDIYF